LGIMVDVPIVPLGLTRLVDTLAHALLVLLVSYFFFVLASFFTQKMSLQEPSSLMLATVIVLFVIKARGPLLLVHRAPHPAKHAMLEHGQCVLELRTLLNARQHV
jgi:hypothetical protein